MGAPIPKDFDAAEFPIIAVHYFGVDLRERREIWWDLARQGFRRRPSREWFCSREVDRERTEPTAGATSGRRPHLSPILTHTTT